MFLWVFLFFLAFFVFFAFLHFCIFAFLCHWFDWFSHFSYFSSLIKPKICASQTKVLKSCYYIYKNLYYTRWSHQPKRQNSLSWIKLNMSKLSCPASNIAKYCNILLVILVVSYLCAIRKRVAFLVITYTYHPIIEPFMSDPIIGHLGYWFTRTWN